MRNYKIGKSILGIELDSPFKFMEYTAPVKERIACAGRGEVLDVSPTRAGDEVPARTFVRSKSEFPAGMDNYTIDLSQYEAFLTEEDCEFRLSMHANVPQDLKAAMEDGKMKLMIKVEEQSPIYYIYDYKGNTIFDFHNADNESAAMLKMSGDLKDGELYIINKIPAYHSLFYLNMAAMILFTCNAAFKDSILIHSSVIKYSGGANIFLGASGTGKSTHSRLWLENIDGAELLNDDNPVIVFENGKARVFGTPWSGKTPCYRNLSVPLNAIVRLNQAPENNIEEYKGVKAYAILYPSASSIKWNRDVMDKITATVSNIVMAHKCYLLNCLPDRDAALLCRDMITR